MPPVSKTTNEEEPTGPVAVQEILKHVESNEVLAKFIKLLDGKK